LAPIDVVRDGALRMIRRFACTQSEYLPLERSRFDAMVSCARERLLGRGLECAALVTRILELRLALVQKKQVYSGMAQNLSSLLPSNFLDVYELEELRHIPRYLQAMLIRCERAAQNPKRDCEHERIAQEYERRIEAMPGDRHDGRLRQLRWMVRELRVSLFAQELGTAFPVSQKKIDRALVGEG
jgi:ATP-dependent helicase HrpA